MDKNKHPIILNVPDELWDEIEYFTKGETSQNSWPSNCSIQKSD